MSIQKTTAKRKSKKIWAYVKQKNVLAIGIEVFSRTVNHDALNVYFRYKHKTFPFHPAFERYYLHPPLKYCNFKTTRLYHWIHHPDRLDGKPFVLEPNDHPFAPACQYEPYENLMRSEQVLELYSNPQCKKILVESSGQMELFQHYFPQILNKCRIVRLGAMPQVTMDELSKKSLERLTYLCLASDFDSKGVDLLIDAWLKFPNRNQCKLILCCPNVSEAYQKLIENQEDIVWDRTAPLKVVQKAAYYKQAHVVLAPLHIDGGANVVEAFEYGLPIITFRCQRSADQIMNQNGFVIDVPFTFYDPDKWGIEWKTQKEYLQILKDEKSKGRFDMVKSELLKHIEYFYQNPVQALEMGKRSLALAESEYSLKKRNQVLLEVYQEALRS